MVKLDPETAPPVARTTDRAYDRTAEAMQTRKLIMRLGSADHKEVRFELPCMSDRSQEEWPAKGAATVLLPPVSAVLF